VADADRDFLRGEILAIVENQLRDNDPPETRATLARLLREGHSEPDAKRMIACVVAAEVFEILRAGRAHDHDRYVAALAALPELPR
jgi:hypothetical protein